MKQDNKENSLLTTVLPQALNGKASSSDSDIWVASVIDAVKQDLPKLAKKYNSVQTAFPVTVGVDFPIVAMIRSADEISFRRCPELRSLLASMG